VARWQTVILESMLFGPEHVKRYLEIAGAEGHDRQGGGRHGGLERA
jgi:hypothetical protein